MNKYLPEAPQNVRAVVNGVEIPISIRYQGKGPHGENVWAAIWPGDMEPPDWEDFGGLRADSLPAMTALIVEMPQV